MNVTFKKNEQVAGLAFNISTIFDHSVTKYQNRELGILFVFWQLRFKVMHQIDEMCTPYQLKQSIHETFFELLSSKFVESLINILIRNAENLIKISQTI